MIIYGKVIVVAGKRIVKELTQSITSKKNIWVLSEYYQIAEKNPKF